MLRRRKRMQDDPTQPDLPIVPMLDMSFQLMAFFILTFKPGPTEGQLAMLLPAAGTSGPGQALVENPEVKYTATVSVSATVVDVGFGIRPNKGDAATENKALPHVANGRPLVSSGAAGTIDTENFVAEMVKAVDEVKQKNKALPPDAQLPLPKLDILFADEVRYQVVIRILDDAKRAGFQKVTPMEWKDGKP